MTTNNFRPNSRFTQRTPQVDLPTRSRDRIATTIEAAVGKEEAQKITGMVLGRNGVVNVSQVQDVSANAPQTVFVNEMTSYSNQTQYMTYVIGMGTAQLTKQGRGNASAATTLFMVPPIPINRSQESRELERRNNEKALAAGAFDGTLRVLPRKLYKFTIEGQEGENDRTVLMVVPTTVCIPKGDLYELLDWERPARPEVSNEEAPESQEPPVDQDDEDF